MTDKIPGKSEVWIDPKDITPSPFNQRAAAPRTSSGEPEIWIDPKNITPNPFNQRAVEFPSPDALLDVSPDALPSSPFAATPPTVEEWLSFMEWTSRGIDPVLRDFLRENPKFFDPAGYEDEAISPRKLNLLSETLRASNGTLSNVEKGKPWVVPQMVAEGIVGREMTGALIAFAEERGLKVQLGNSLSAKPAIPSPDNLGPKR